jgi:hypothetical protein
MISEHDRQVLERTPSWDPRGGIAEQRRAWEDLAIAYNQDLPAIGALEQNVELRLGLHADVAVPKGAGRHPVVIYLHGGGWAFGSPVSFRKLGMQFAEAGYLTINLDYRLAPEDPFPRWKTRHSRSNGRETTRGDGMATAGGSRSAAIPQAQTWRSARSRRAVPGCARWCGPPSCSTAPLISPRPQSATNLFPDFSSS